MAAAPFTTWVDGKTGRRPPAFGSAVPRRSDLWGGDGGMDRGDGHLRVPKVAYPAALSSLNRSSGDVAPRAFGRTAWHRPCSKRACLSAVCLPDRSRMWCLIGNLWRAGLTGQCEDRTGSELVLSRRRLALGDSQRGQAWRIRRNARVGARHWCRRAPPQTSQV
jgi:hypothetical protein